MKESNTFRRPIGIVILAIWSAFALLSLSASFSAAVKHWFAAVPMLLEAFRSFGTASIVLMIIEVIGLWRFNLKAILFADVLLGLWNVVIICTIFLTGVVRPTLTRPGLTRLMILFTINLALIIYVNRHSFFDRLKSLRKLYEDQTREKERFKAAMKMRKT